MPASSKPGSKTGAKTSSKPGSKPSSKPSSKPGTSKAVTKQILTQVSTHTLHVGTGQEHFEVSVRNLSDRFATFAVELFAPGVDRNTMQNWYRLTPDLSAKIPAGDQITFVVNLLKLPPIQDSFAGKISLSVNISCVELGEEDRQMITLVVDGSSITPPVLWVPTTDFQATPGELIEIPVQVENQNRNTANIALSIHGLPHAWLVDGYKRRLQLSAQSRADVLFICQLPPSREAVNHVYAFDIEASQIQAATVRQSATLDVLPTGTLNLSCNRVDTEASPAASPDEKTKKAQTGKAREKNKRKAREKNKNDVHHYVLTLDNDSNVDQTVAMTLNRTDVPWFKGLEAMVRQRAPQAARTTRHRLQLTPSQVSLKAGDSDQMHLLIQPDAPWWGWQRRQQFSLQPQEQKTKVIPPEQSIALIANPKIPFWLQCLGIGLLGLVFTVISQYRIDHRGPVNSVQFDGQANTVISGGDDHTIRRWRVFRGLRDIEVLPDINKAVRVVRYRPHNNDMVAAGLENGEIQLWDFLSTRSPQPLLHQRDDRVRDLQFSQDSRHLFSAHGSGLVLQWPLSDWGDREQPIQPSHQRKFDFAIEAIAPLPSHTNTGASLSPNDATAFNILALGGQFNQLVLWDVDSDRTHSLNQILADPNHYITSVDTTENASTQLATADNQGRITLWNVGQCFVENNSFGSNFRNNLPGRNQCSQTDQWSDGHDGQAVHAVAFTKNGCYLASGGDDGRVMLWSLNKTGQVIDQQQLVKYSQTVNSVDIVHKADRLIIVSGTDTHEVELHRSQATNRACP